MSLQSTARWFAAVPGSVYGKVNTEELKRVSIVALVAGIVAFLSVIQSQTDKIVDDATLATLGATAIGWAIEYVRRKFQGSSVGKIDKPDDTPPADAMSLKKAA